MHANLFRLAFKSLTTIFLFDRLYASGFDLFDGLFGRLDSKPVQGFHSAGPLFSLAISKHVCIPLDVVPFPYRQMSGRENDNKYLSYLPGVAFEL